MSLQALSETVARLRRWLRPYMPVLRAIGFAASITLVVLVGVTAAGHVKTNELTWWPLPLAFVLSAAWWVGLARAWGLVASGHASRRDISVWCRTQALRYLPGGFWAPASRTTVLEGGLVDRVGTVAAENVIALCAALAVGGAALALGGRAWGIALLVCAPLPALVARHTQTRTRVAPDRARAATVNNIAAFVLYAVSAALVQGAIGGPADHPHSLHTLLLVAGAASVAWGIGLVVIVAPGGVGVRELAYVGLLHGVLPSGQLAAGAVTSRIVLICAELAVLVVAGRPQSKTSARTTAVLAFARRHVVFIVLFCGGIAIRAIVFAAYRPALVYWDSTGYISQSHHLSPSPQRPLFYPFFLHLLPFSHALWVIPLVQHVMGLVMALLIYAVLCRLKLPRWAAALAAAPILFNGFQLDLEEYVLTETLYDFLLVVAVTLMLWKRRPSPGVAGLVGLVVALVALTRANGLFDLVPFLVVVVVLRWDRAQTAPTRLRRWGRSLRPALAPLLAMAICFYVPVAAYAVWFHHANGPNSPYNITDWSGRFLYARVAPFADCTKFTVPADERHLCPIDPVGHRPRTYGSSVEYYMWGRTNSPLYTLNATSDQKRLLAGDFAKRVIKAQPVTYLKTVAHDFLRGFTLTPNRTDGELPIFRWQFQSYMPLFFAGETQYVQGFGETPHVRKGLAEFLKHYRRYAYVPGPILTIGMILGLLVGLGIGVPRARVRRSGLCGASLLFSSVALVAFGTTVLGNQFTWRYQLPLTVFLPAAAAISLTAIVRGLTSTQRATQPVVAPALRPERVSTGAPSGATG